MREGNLLMPRATIVINFYDSQLILITFFTERERGRRGPCDDGNSLNLNRGTNDEGGGGHAAALIDAS